MSQRLNISCLHNLMKSRSRGFSSSRVKIEPTIRGTIYVSPDYPQLLKLSDSSGDIPCICPEFSLEILTTTIDATRWYLTLVDKSEMYKLPAYYLEIREFQVVNELTEPPAVQRTHSIVRYPDSDRSELCGILLHVYPVFKLVLLTYLVLFQVGKEKVYIFFTGDDLLVLHSLLKTNQGYLVTNILRKHMKSEDKPIKTYISTNDTSVETIHTVTSGVITELHKDHSTIDEIITQIIDFDSGHFLLSTSTHLFVTHLPSFLPIWGLRVGAKIRVSEVKVFSMTMDDISIKFVWCCHHTRIELLSASMRPGGYIPYLPNMFAISLAFTKLAPSGVYILTQLIDFLKSFYTTSWEDIAPLRKLFDLTPLPSSNIQADIHRIIFTDKCIVIPFNELSSLSPLSLSKITSTFSLQKFNDEFFRDLYSYATLDFKVPPFRDIQNYYSLAEDKFKGYLIGRIALCPNTGHIILSDSAMSLPINFTKGIFPNQLFQIVGSCVAIEDYVLTLDKTSFPNHPQHLTQAHISTKYDNLVTIKHTPTILKTRSTYIFLVKDKSNIIIDHTPSKVIECKFQINVQIYMYAAVKSENESSESMIGELCLVFKHQALKWWHLIEVGWLYHWSGYDNTQINTYIILRGYKTLFNSNWSLYPIGEMPAEPLNAVENDVITLLHKMREGETKVCVISGMVQRVLFHPAKYPKANLVKGNKEWLVEMAKLRPFPLIDLHNKYGYSLLPVFYTLNLSIIFPVTDAVYLPVYIDLPQCRMPINLTPGSWVTLTGVKIRIYGTLLRGNIDLRGSISVISHPPSANLLPSIYKRLRTISPDNFNTFRTLNIQVAKSQINNFPPNKEISQNHPPTNTGMYSNRFNLSKTQRYLQMEKSRYTIYAELLRLHKILRLSIRLECIIALTISKQCYCCKPQESFMCASAVVKIQATYYGYIGVYKVLLRAVNKCTMLLTSITETQLEELGTLVINKTSVEVDRNFFEATPPNPAPSWLYSWFTNMKWPGSCMIDGIVTHSTTHPDQKSSTSNFQFVLYLHNFQYI
ncbi:hypothetical protein LOD99_13159 [Oopsacas minuta]|uniref:CST complex subunit CTC1 n=1 Tax=Oopsacas minuta TaxID=111878 RepID=A0AAV7JB09_9METZ|nr:hypothetical protein LOD99_13159 [Oopsacas minuta]